MRGQVHPGRWSVACLLFLLAACGGMPSPDLAIGDALPRYAELTGVAFFPQQDHQCGPSALATVLGAGGVPRTPDQLASAVYLPERKGSLQFELLAATRRAGLLPYPLAPRLSAVITEIAAGHPVLVLQKQGWASLADWHYAVVIGYDLTENKVILRSGREARLTLSIDDFDRSWAGAGRWAFVALPADQIPATASEVRYIRAAVALEAVAPLAAARAYQTALQRWPGNLPARIGIGNAAYRRHDLAAAEAAYRQATIDHPESADAWNNLAQTLHETGRPVLAQSAAEQAVALGGARATVYAATLAAIRESQY
ncbi:MAG: PA2778 family cysteine peptidase [Bacteroidota bacterium]